MPIWAVDGNSDQPLFSGTFRRSPLNPVSGLRNRRISVSDTSIREIAQATGAQLLEWQCTKPEAVREFHTATGDIEFTTDGTSVNTTAGWREVKLGIFSKRDRGQPALPSAWGDRQLPKPNTCVAFAAIEASAQFGSRWKAWAQRLDVRDTSAVTVLADGAKWIWEEARLNLSGSQGVLDVYHALEHISDTSKTLFGEGTAESNSWTNELRTALLERGWKGFDACWQHTRRQHPERGPQATALHELRTYLGNHVGHLNYAERLQEGRSIGSGQVEGACKNLIGRRLKQTAARWRVRRLNRMAGLCSIMSSQQWTEYWHHQAA